MALILVDQLDSGARVPPQVGSFANCANVHLELTCSPAM
jgi:hypothetical protein